MRVNKKRGEDNNCRLLCPLMTAWICIFPIGILEGRRKPLAILCIRRKEDIEPDES
jgi:hypothetical protein